MALQQALRKGDWVVASAQNGSMIRGQAAHDLPVFFGPAALGILLAGDAGEEPSTIPINVNFWTVVLDRAHLLPSEPF